MDRVYTCLGASNHTKEDRADLDYYSTSKEGTRKCLNWVRDNLFSDFNNHEWYEPACGKLDIAEVISENGVNDKKIHCSDIILRNKNPSLNIEIKDFYDVDKIDTTNNVIITNPPYGKEAEKFLLHALDILNDGDYYITLQRIQFLEGKSRGKIFKENPPKYVLVPSGRIKCFKNGIDDGNSSAVCFSWFVFQKGNKNNPTVFWI